MTKETVTVNPRYKDRLFRSIFGKEEKLREQIRGAELYEKHYDPVEKELRKKAETTEKQQTKNERTKNRKKSGKTDAKNSRKTGRKKGR